MKMRKSFIKLDKSTRSAEHMCKLKSVNGRYDNEIDFRLARAISLPSSNGLIICRS